jgi:GH15 family glucan-1,4-alpha-glucosidase
MASSIADYALIGDLGTAALVSRTGSIDWLCWPRFDSDACFAALLGTSEHGRWLVAPRDAHARTSRNYRENTLILETRFETSDGAAVLVDFMPPRERDSHLIRIVIGERGSVAFRSELILRFGYGAIIPWVTRADDHSLRAIAGPDMAVLRSSATMRGENFKTVGEFTVTAGESWPFVLSFGLSHRPPPAPVDPFEKLHITEGFWRDWTRESKFDGPWKSHVTRSLITLKALTYAPTGGLAAAPTTSLPEHIGGARNWDYRFCWLRDATLTLLALMNAGYYEEAQNWREWLLRAVAGSPPQIQIMYGLRGERRLTEWQVPWLPGYRGSKPVRIGNAAHSQRQLDIFVPMKRAGRCNANCSRTSRRSGVNRTRAYGRFAAALNILSIPKRWPGSLSIAPYEAPKRSPCPARSITGAKPGPSFIATCANAALTASLAALYAHMEAKSSTPAC